MRALLLSHSIFFAAGFAAGKLIDHDELMIYRSLHETGATKFRRAAERVALGLLAMATLIATVRAVRK